MATAFRDTLSCACKLCVIAKESEKEELRVQYSPNDGDVNLLWVLCILAAHNSFECNEWTSLHETIPTEQGVHLDLQPGLPLKSLTPTQL